MRIQLVAHLGHIIVQKESDQIQMKDNAIEQYVIPSTDGDVQNPVFHKIPGAVCMGIAGKQHIPDDNNTDHQCQHLVLYNPHQKKNKLNEKETEETAKLSTAELQRLVLLEQLQLTRMQIE
ncbi:hypothetical protein JTB14_007432 [Gonioctena quinquepunctata]|nr:hypothetical protein JTB14_007432 [Gonioctena quinquepunctata]